MWTRRLSPKRRSRFNVRYKVDFDNEDIWLSLDEIKDKVPEGRWTHNQFFEQVDVAIESGYTPSYFWGLDDFDKALIMARFRAKALIESYEAHIRELEAKKRNKGKR